MPNETAVYHHSKDVSSHLLTGIPLCVSLLAAEKNLVHHWSSHQPCTHATTTIASTHFTFLCCFTYHSHRTWLDSTVDLPSVVKTVNPKQATLLLFKEDPGLVLPQLSLAACQLKVALHVVHVFGDQVDLGQLKTRISVAIDKVSSVGENFTEMCSTPHISQSIYHFYASYRTMYSRGCIDS